MAEDFTFRFRGDYTPQDILEAWYAEMPRLERHAIQVIRNPLLILHPIDSYGEYHRIRDPYTGKTIRNFVHDGPYPCSADLYVDFE